LQIAAVVDRNGRVSATRVLRGSVGDLLRSRALEELQNWEFQPASRNGEPIDVDIVVEIAFQFRAVQQAR
jgi:TonB family protein